jgi:hypothetical protein
MPETSGTVAEASRAMPETSGTMSETSGAGAMSEASATAEASSVAAAETAAATASLMSSTWSAWHKHHPFIQQLTRNNAQSQIQIFVQIREIHNLFTNWP